MDTYFHKTPLITSSITAYLGQTYTAQTSPMCAHFELRAIECYEAYGLHGATKKEICQDYLDDLRECLYKKKTCLRVQAMQNERHRQYKEGLRKERYAPSPDQDHE